MDIPRLWTERLNIVKISVLPNLIYGFNTILNNSTVSYLITIDKVIIKFIWRGKRSRIANSVWEEKNKFRGLQQLDFKSYCENTVINRVWGCGKDRQISRTEWRAIDPRNRPTLTVK